MCEYLTSYVYEVHIRSVVIVIDVTLSKIAIDYNYSILEWFIRNLSTVLTDFKTAIFSIVCEQDWFQQTQVQYRADVINKQQYAKY